jgi:hypothetical protein
MPRSGASSAAEDVHPGLDVAHQSSFCAIDPPRLSDRHCALNNQLGMNGDHDQADE